MVQAIRLTMALGACALPSTVQAFITSAAPAQVLAPLRMSDSTGVINEPVPATFNQCIAQASTAARAAIAENEMLMEVEFPPLSADYLEDAISSAYDLSRSNVRLAVQFATEFAAQDGKKVSILLPDEAELERAIEDEGTDTPFNGVTLNTLTPSTSKSAVSFDQLIGGWFGQRTGEIEPVEGTDIYVAIVFSCQELPDLEQLHKASPNTPIVFFNMKLDTQRGDLGLPAFPPKSLHYNFLSRVKPVYLLRSRNYSRSLPQPPFVVSYQGAQFRVYPGPYQSLLETGGRYRLVQTDDIRPSLGEFKEIITQSLDLGDYEEGAVLGFLRKGYKTKTW
ncbi:unnamed protein product [Chrysoparadoxa australica]